MFFWQAIMIIAIVAIVMGSVVNLARMGMRYSENIKRIQNGYPTLDGAQPAGRETIEGEAAYEAAPATYHN